MKILTALFIAINLYLLLMFAPIYSSAQSTSEDYLNSGSNYTENIPESNTTTSTTTAGFNPMWLLTLLLIPAAIIIYEGINALTENEHQQRYSYPAYAGVKGGKANHAKKTLEKTTVKKKRKSAHTA